MTLIRETAVAGQFYPGNARELSTTIRGLLAEVPIQPGPPPKALIVAHAGYIYSGPVDKEAIALLDMAAVKVIDHHRACGATPSRWLRRVGFFRGHRVMKNTIYAFLLLALTAQADDANHASARAEMVAEVQYYASMAVDAEDTSFDEGVIRSLATVERHEFVPRGQRPYAYENRPLPIGHGQTISQPYIVALMTELVEPEPDDVVLEIGTGSGYQAAILAELVEQVYSIEIIDALASEAKSRLVRLGYDNVTTKLADGYYGWDEHAPFDAIVVTAAASHVPPPLIQQLKRGGRMVIPVGGRFSVQQLLLIEKTEDDEVITRQIAAVRFVPLTGKH